MRWRLAGVAATATALAVAGVLVLAPSRPVHTHGTDPGRAAAATAPTGLARPALPAPRQEPFDRAAHSTTDPGSIWVIVNKTHPVEPSDYRPDIEIVRGYQVARAAAKPLERLLDAGDRRGLGLKIESAFRSYGYQLHVHAATAAARGEAEADRVSARAGYSEHQTGLAVDLITPGDPACDFEPCFAHTPAGRWLADNAWRWGFVVRYQPATTAVTGYAPEPWHLRYVGRPLAAELRREGVRTLEEFFGVPGGGYPRWPRDPDAGVGGRPVSRATASLTTSQRCSRIEANMLV
ncbi:MAG TPA: M15 family metallopeptidase [Nocardioides sp.]|uniref:M15 family metallopeptidase n=1 Tax=Nocardioides sp. TaxID=35761 RepID=UPI002E3728CD|nr:M15 family metallopeptidase [Nocardioides sp.]HEX5091039.1 M15 family metallopeptidase [Nocardioides sp.]